MTDVLPAPVTVERLDRGPGPEGVPGDAAERGRTWRRRPNRRVLAAATAIVVVVDQITKFAAWRLLSRQDLDLNTGASDGWPAWVGRLYEGAWSGAVLDVLGAAGLYLAARWIIRRRLPRPVLLALATWWAGEASNVLDRLVTHWFLAPGRPRGAVDWFRLGPMGNLADVACTLGWVSLLIMAAVWAARRWRRRAVPGLLVVALALASAVGVSLYRPHPTAPTTSGTSAVRQVAIPGTGYRLIEAWDGGPDDSVVLPDGVEVPGDQESYFSYYRAQQYEMVEMYDPQTTGYVVVVLPADVTATERLSVQRLSLPRSAWNGPATQPQPIAVLLWPGAPSAQTTDRATDAAVAELDNAGSSTLPAA